MTGIIAGVVFIGLLVAGGWAFQGLMILLALIGFYEYVRMNQLKWRDPIALAGFAAMLLLVVPWAKLGLAPPSTMAIVWGAMFLLLAITVVARNRVTLDHAALLLLGAIYIGYGFSAMAEVREAPSGLFLSLMAFAAIWASDIGAYFFGRAFGKRKLWPAISPNKTIEGSLGGVALSLAVAACFAVAAPEEMAVGKALAIGAIAAIAGQFGDLIQSAYKRLRGIKDTGTLLPGHGGVLDRCDSWLIVFPLLVLTGLLAG